MKAIFRAVLASALLASAAFAPAMAQEVVGTLHVDTSPVMVSTGGDFTTVSGDTALHVGDRVQISAPGQATLTYNSGYVLHYEAPGVYTVQLAPAGAMTSAAAGTGASTVATVGVVLGAAALSAAAVDANGDVVPPDQPVSR